MRNPKRPRSPISRAGFMALIAGILSQTTVGATDIVVSTNGDGPSLSGSLRQALQFNAVLGGGNTILFASNVTGVMTLTSGALFITNNVTISGPGAGQLAVSGNGVSRVFHVSSNAVVNISGLAIVRGRAGIPGGAGVLLDSGTLVLARCTLATNYAVFGSVVDYGGGGIYVNAGALRLENCTLSDNFAMYGSSGAIYLNGGSLALVNSTVSRNSFYALAGAGGIYQKAGTLALTNCSVARNDDIAGGFGGGIYKAGGTATLRSTVVAANSTTEPAPDCSGAFTSAGYNLIGNTAGSFGFGALGDQLNINPQLGPLQDNGGPTFTIAPQPGSPVVDQGNSSGLLTDQRGRFRPSTNNPSGSIPFGGDYGDIGAVEVSPSILLVTNNNDSGPGSLRQATAEASAFDGDTIRFASHVVGTITLTTGEIGIEKSLNIAGPGAAVLAVSGNQNSRVLEVLSGKVSVTGLTLSDGRVAGTAGFFEQNGAQARGGGIFNQTTLTLNHCVVSNCVAQGGQGGETDSGFAGGGGNGLGGGIANIGTLSMTNCAIIGNSAGGGSGGIATSGGSDGTGGQGYGGGLYSAGAVTLVRCALANNEAIGGPGNGGVGSGSGGGFYNDLTATLLACTVASNAATGSPFDFGGGIFDNGTALVLRSLTIAGNQADYGGGLSAFAADLGNTILAGNSASGGGPDCSGSITSSDYNLIQNTSDCTITGTTTHNILGQDPLLGLLANNGGLAPTRAIGFGSPAVDKGKSFGATTDQRGAPRPFDHAVVANAGGGDGSDIGAFEFGIPALKIHPADTGAAISWPSWYGDFSLQQQTNLAGSAWSAPPEPLGDDTTNKFIVVNPPIGNRFYRLLKP